LRHIDYGYTHTVHAAQGKTSPNVIAVVESYRTNLTTQKNFYVEISRAKDNVEIFTDNKDSAIKTLTENSGIKQSALELESTKQIQTTSQDKMQSIDAVMSNLLEKITSPEVKIKTQELNNDFTK